MISMAAATLIGSIIAAGSAGVAGGLNARSQREANEANLSIYNLQRSDQLKQAAVEQKNTEAMLSLNRQQVALTAQEARLNRDERKEQTTYDRLQNAANIYTKILNEQNALNARPLAALGK